MISRIFPKSVLASLVFALLSGASPAAAQSAQRPQLDYEFFKARVQPIFLKRRSPDHARCYACHEHTKHERGLSLESLSPGATAWNEDQSRKNFAAVSRVTTPGNPDRSLFPFHPLAPEGGGDTEHHAGGRQFEDKNDPEWQTLKAWVLGQTYGTAK